MKRVGNFLLEEDEMELLPIIAPEEYVQRNESKIDKEYGMLFLQNQLHELTNSFLNGGFSRTGFALYPLVQDLSVENKQKLLLIKKAMEKVDGKEFRRALELYDKRDGSVLCASVISQLSKDLSRLSKNKRKKTTIKPFGALDLSQYKDDKTKKNVRDLNTYAQKKLRGYLSAFYLQGSLATNDYILGWSDCDTVSVVSRHCMDDPSLIMELRKRLYAARQYFLKIDPLQHHGTIVISEYELNNYCQVYFPLEALKYARAFFNDAGKEAQVRDSKGEQLKALFWFVNYFRMLDAAKAYNSYDVKNILHASTLFPTLYLQAKGVHVYKKFSFEEAKKDFSRQQWSIIDDISTIREHWRPYPVVPFVKAIARQNPMLAYQLNVRIADRFNHVAKKNNLPLKKIIKDMHMLYEEAWSKIKRARAK